MLEKEIKNNLVICGETMEIYTKDTLWISIPVEGELYMTLLIQKERVLELKSFDYEELVFKMFEIGGEEFESPLPKLTTVTTCPEGIAMRGDNKIEKIISMESLPIFIMEKIGKTF